MIITKNRINDTIHHIPNSGLVYLNNAKVACSTIKKSLWLWADPDTFDNETGPHSRVIAPFCRNLEILTVNMESLISSTFFTVVRNPFVRILSAYMDKVERRPRDARVWHAFARRYRLSADASLTFREFLERVTTEEACLVDQHFAPQHLNVMSRFVSLDFVGHIEDMESVGEFLDRYGIKIASHVPHITKARESINLYYGSQEIELVRKFYSADFELFGYSDDPNMLSPIRPAEVRGPSREILTSLISTYTAHSFTNRKNALEELSKYVPDLLTEYNLLESGAFTLAQIKLLGDRAIRGEFSNWRLIARIAQELLAHDMIYEASAVALKAKTVMYDNR